MSANIVAFCRHLRSEGFNISAAEEADALKTLEILDPFSAPETMRLALRTVLTRTPSQVIRFDELHDLYWKEVEKAVDSKPAEQAENKPKPSKGQQQDPQFQALKDWLNGNKPSEDEADLYAYSAAEETLSRKDFSTMTDDEMREVFDLIQMMARRLARQRNRRSQKDKNGTLDLRKTLRQNMRRGGEMLEIVKKKPQKQRIQLVLLCDVSKSMELYSRFLIQFSFAFQQVFRRIETFVFSTYLLKISEILRGSDYSKVLNDLSENVPNWSGGTRIGESLATFNNDFGSKYLTSKTIVVIMSDGWDTGDVEILATAMQHIQRKASKVIWLNPLAGHPNFEANVAGMAAAMPYVDVFAPVHNVESLRQLQRFLK